MECGKLTAKLRDMVMIRFMEGGVELKHYHNIELPDQIKAIHYKSFELQVPKQGRITFKIWLDENPAEWPEAKRKKNTDKIETKEMRIAYQGDRKKLVSTVSTLLERPAKYLGAPTFAFQSGEYRVEHDGALIGPESQTLITKLTEMGIFEA